MTKQIVVQHYKALCLTSLQNERDKVADLVRMQDCQRKGVRCQTMSR